MTADKQVIELSEGITIEFKDLTNRYFGDFNRVFIEVQVKIDRKIIIQQPELLSLIDPEQAEIIYSTSLEQMAVPTAEIPHVRNSLIQAFIESTEPYLKKATFIENLIKRESLNFGKKINLNSQFL